MRVAVLGCGTIGSAVVRAVADGKAGPATVAGVAGRPPRHRGRELCRELGIPYLEDGAALAGLRPDVVVEAASHGAVRQFVPGYLRAGIDVIVTSVGALGDPALRSEMEAAAAAGGGKVAVPSGGIGGLDALRAAMIAGVDRVRLTSSKPPAAWKNIAYVEQLGVDLDAVEEPVLLYEGPAEAAVRHFPQNVNIAAALSLAGIGFDATQVRVYADPTIRRNRHVIEVAGPTGEVRVELNNVPDPDNPKTTWLAALSAVAALRRRTGWLTVGT